MDRFGLDFACLCSGLFNHSSRPIWCHLRSKTPNRLIGQGKAQLQRLLLGDGSIGDHPCSEIYHGHFWTSNRHYLPFFLLARERQDRESAKQIVWEHGDGICWDACSIACWTDDGPSPRRILEHWVPLLAQPPKFAKSAWKCSICGRSHDCQRSTSRKINLYIWDLRSLNFGRHYCSFASEDCACQQDSKLRDVCVRQHSHSVRQCPKIDSQCDTDSCAKRLSLGSSGLSYPAENTQIKKLAIFGYSCLNQ